MHATTSCLTLCTERRCETYSRRSASAAQPGTRAERPGPSPAELQRRHHGTTASGKACKCKASRHRSSVHPPVSLGLMLCRKQATVPGFLSVPNCLIGCLDFCSNQSVHRWNRWLCLAIFAIQSEPTVAWEQLTAAHYRSEPRLGRPPMSSTLQRGMHRWSHYFTALVSLLPFLAPKLLVSDACPPGPAGRSACQAGCCPMRSQPAAHTMGYCIGSATTSLRPAGDMGVRSCLARARALSPLGVWGNATAATVPPWNPERARGAKCEQPR